MCKAEDWYLKSRVDLSVWIGEWLSKPHGQLFWHWGISKKLEDHRMQPGILTPLGCHYSGLDQIALSVHNQCVHTASLSPFCYVAVGATCTFWHVPGWWLPEVSHESPSEVQWRLSRPSLCCWRAAHWKLSRAGKCLFILIAISSSLHKLIHSNYVHSLYCFVFNMAWKNLSHQLSTFQGSGGLCLSPSLASIACYFAAFCVLAHFLPAQPHGISLCLRGHEASVALHCLERLSS